MESIKLIVKIYKERNSLEGPYKIYIITLPHDIDFNRLFDRLLSEEGWAITDSFYDSYLVQNVFNQGAGGSAVSIILSIYQNISIEKILDFISNKIEPTAFLIKMIKVLFTKVFSLIKFLSNNEPKKQTLKYKIYRVTKREEIIEQVSHYRLTQGSPCKVITKKEIKTLEEVVIVELEDDITN